MTKVTKDRDSSIFVAMNSKPQVQFVQALIHATYTYLFYAKSLSITKTKIVAFLEICNFISNFMKLPKIVCYTYLHCYGLQMLQI
jgi:hypothetical protein